jgi:GT2 family glycosyltransferase
VRKALYLEAGGLDEQFAVCCNDADLCLKLRKAGYRNVWTPFAQLYHHESATRGLDDAPEKKKVFIQEITYMREKWGKDLLNDPNYNPNLTLDREDFSLADPPKTQST